MKHQQAVGRRIRLAREALGFTLRELAHSLNVGESAWGNYELGLRPVNHFAIHRFAVRHGVSLDYLLSGKKEKLTYELLLKIERLEGSAADGADGASD